MLCASPALHYWENLPWKPYLSSLSPPSKVVGATPLCCFLLERDVVIPPPPNPQRIIDFLKPYVLKMHFTNKFMSAQVINTPTATVACSASSQEKALRSSLETTRDVAAAVKIGKILGECLVINNIPAITVHLKREQKYRGKVRAVVDSVKDAGVKLL